MDGGISLWNSRTVGATLALPRGPCLLMDQPYWASASAARRASHPAVSQCNRLVGQVAPNDSHYTEIPDSPVGLLSSILAAPDIRHKSVGRDSLWSYR